MVYYNDTAIKVKMVWHVLRKDENGCVIMHGFSSGRCNT